MYLLVLSNKINNYGANSTEDEPVYLYSQWDEQQGLTAVLGFLTPQCRLQVGYHQSLCRHLRSLNGASPWH